MSKFLIFNIGQLVTVDAERATADNPLGVIENAAIAFDNDRIVWLGPESELDKSPYDDDERLNAEGKVLLPGLIDSHTHPVFAGNRAHEFEMRLNGTSYLDIAKAGGGIAKTVSETRNASEEELFTLAQERLSRMLAFGVTTVEAKSGYGLDFESELKSLRVIQKLRQECPQDIVATYMGGHDLPPEYKGKTNEYVTHLCDVQIPEVSKQKLATFCDVFCEDGYFDVAQTRKILEAAQKHGLKLKVHAEEFCTLGGAELAGELHATSADHLLHISDAGIAALKKGGTVATLLPGTAFYLRLKQYAPADKLLAAGVPVAIATDFNPGSCMSENLQLSMTLACLQMNMTPADVVQGVTIHAARALDLHKDRGSLSVGKRADSVLFDITTWQELLYHFGINFVSGVWVNGSLVLAR